MQNNKTSEFPSHTRSYEDTSYSMYVVSCSFRFVSFRVLSYGRCAKTGSRVYRYFSIPKLLRSVALYHNYSCWRVGCVAWNKQRASFFYSIPFFSVVLSLMASCIANAFICLCPHNPHIEDEPRESGISSDRILIQITIGESKTLFFLSQSHKTESQLQRGCFYQNVVVYLCDILLLLFLLSFSSAFFRSQPAPFTPLYLKSHLLLVPFHVLHFFIIFILLLFSLSVSLPPSHTHTCTCTHQLTWRFVWFFLQCSVLFVLLFLDYCSVILAVCGVIARIYHTIV